MFVVAGYFYAYRRAKDDAARRKPKGPFGRTSSALFCAVMAFSAATGLALHWDTSILVLVIGGFAGCPMNILWFYAGCVGVLAKEQTNTRTP
jgi:hypothetical protein